MRWHIITTAPSPRLNVHQRAAVGQPELRVMGVPDLEAYVHVVVREAHVELGRLDDRGDVVPLDPHQALHAAGVVGRNDRERLDLAAATQAYAHLRHERAIVDVPVEHVLAPEARELGAREIRERARDRPGHPSCGPDGVAQQAGPGDGDSGTPFSTGAS
jgi:hypothetical protein